MRTQADLDRLGWNTDAHVELLWSLSRAPDADTALRAITRLAEALESGGEDNAPLYGIDMTTQSVELQSRV